MAAHAEAPRLEGEDQARAACGRVLTSDIRQTAPSEIYHSVGDDGIPAFSDTPRDGADTPYAVHRIRDDRNFDVNFSGPFSTELKEYALRDAEEVFKLLGQLIGSERLRRVNYNVQLIEGSEAFHRYKQQIAPSLNTATGFYHADTQTAVVRRQSDALTRQVIRHETMHVLLDALVGPLPPWVNEGLAEYAEAPARRSPPSDVAPQQLARMSHRQFHDPRRSAQNYALSNWRISQLMGDQTGRERLGAYLQKVSRAPCQRHAGLELFDLDQPAQLGDKKTGP